MAVDGESTDVAATDTDAVHRNNAASKTANHNQSDYDPCVVLFC